MAIIIRCTNKQNNGYTTEITQYGWCQENDTSNKGICTKQELIDFLEKGNRAYTKDYYGNISECYVKSRNGVKYVTTVADHNPAIETDNLLNLPNCN